MFSYSALYTSATVLLIQFHIIIYVKLTLLLFVYLTT